MMDKKWKLLFRVFFRHGLLNRGILGSGGVEKGDVGMSIVLFSSRCGALRRTCAENCPFKGGLHEIPSGLGLARDH